MTKASKTIYYIIIFGLLLVLVNGALGVIFSSLAGDVRAYLAVLTSLIIWTQFDDVIKKVFG